MLTSEPNNAIPYTCTIRRSQIMVSPTYLPREFLRKPPRPVEQRHSNYDAEFDAKTLFFDAFKTSPSEAILLGPPLLNLEPIILNAEFRAIPAEAPLSVRYSKLDRNMQLRVRIPEGTTCIDLKSDLGSMRIRLSPDGSHLFKDQRVATTLSKNNEIPWILDWVRFNVRIHGCNALLLYDNASDRYSIEELRDRLQEVSGLASCVVIDWPFPYGPQVSLTGKWDSDFCQYGQLEHARWRFLSAASSVLNSDVDELVVPDRNESIFERAERSDIGYCSFLGLYVSQRRHGSQLEDYRSARHRDYFFSIRPEMLQSNAKWCVVPSMCNEEAQWRVHGIDGKSSRSAIPADIWYRHFRAINTKWKWNRCDAHDTDDCSSFEDVRLKLLMDMAGL